MPQRPTETPERWPIPGTLYGYVENRKGVAVFRIAGRRWSLGMPFQKSKRTTIMQAAREKLRLYKAGTSPIPPKPTTIGKAILKFVQDRKIKSRTPEAQKALKYGLSMIFPNKGLRVNDDAIQDHLTARIEHLRKTHEESSIAQYANKAAELLRYCQGKRWLSADPWAVVVRPQAPKKGVARTLSNRENVAIYRYLLSNGTPEYRECAILAQLLNATGMRPSEAISLVWGDAVDNPEQHNTIEADKIVLRHTKNGEREIPLDRSIPQTAQIARAVDRLRTIRGTKKRYSSRGARCWRWTTYTEPGKIMAEAFDRCGVVRSGGQTRKQQQQHKAYLWRATVEQRWLREGIREDTAVRVIGHTKNIRQAHYAEKPTAADAVREMRRDLSSVQDVAASQQRNPSAGGASNRATEKKNGQSKRKPRR